MAYVSQEMKAKLAPAIKTVLKKYNVKGTIAVRNHSTLVVNIKQGAIDFIGNTNKVSAKRPCFNDRPYTPAKDHIDVNTHWYHEHFDGVARKFLGELIDAMKGPDFFDESDIQTDYFHRSHYIDINVGAWNKPYALVK